MSRKTESFNPFRKLNLKEKSARRKFLKRAGLIAIAGLGGAVAAGGVTWLGQESHRPELGGSSSEITLGFKEFNNAVVIENGEFRSNLGREVKYWNFSRGVTVDQNRFNTLYNFIETRVESQTGSPLSVVELSSGATFKARLTRNTRPNHFIVLGSETMSYPDWLTEYAATNVGEDPIKSAIKVLDSGSFNTPIEPFDSIDKLASYYLCVETTQGVAKLVDSRGNYVSAAQEAYPNSLGGAYALRQMNISYAQYVSWANEKLISWRDHPQRYHYLVLSENEYESIPQVGLPITKK